MLLPPELSRSSCGAFQTAPRSSAPRTLGSEEGRLQGFPWVDLCLRGEQRCHAQHVGMG